MSILKQPKPVYLFTSIIYNPSSNLSYCIDELVKKLGKADFESSELSFEGTSYYEDEMGEGLKRIILAYENLIPREAIRDIKIFSTELENKFSKANKRTINIDPGYIAEEHVILATGKGFAHRPYLGGGVYADLTLIYRGDKYTTLEWTYPDYGTVEMRALFKDLRDKYRSKLSTD